MAIVLSSPAFQKGDKIASIYTCQGENISPALEWSSIPEGSQSLALIMDDLDAPGSVFTHWVLFNIPPDKKGLEEDVKPVFRLPDGSRQGMNDFGKIGYGGPCPPSGYPHNYRFSLFALDIRLDLEPGISKYQLLDAAKGHILDKGLLGGSFQR